MVFDCIVWYCMLFHCIVWYRIVIHGVVQFIYRVLHLVILDGYTCNAESRLEVSELCFGFWKLFVKQFLGQFCAGRRGKLLICKLLFLSEFAAALSFKHLDSFYPAAGCRLCITLVSNNSFCFSFQGRVYFHFILNKLEFLIGCFRHF